MTRMTISSCLGEKHFTSEDQLRFAALSGDRNPMHLDPVFARRTQFGRQVVHGIHTLLWGLDQFFAGTDLPRPTSLKVRFAKPAFVGDAVQLLCVRHEAVAPPAARVAAEPDLDPG